MPHRSRVAARPVLVLALAAALAAAYLAGCGAAERPFDRVALIPSYWEIVSVAGAPVTGDDLPILSIGRSSSARVELHCGEVDLRYLSDTDGSALSFDEQHVGAGCATGSDGRDAAIRTAIGGVGSWHVVSESEIQMLDGGGRVALELRLTSCNCPHQPPATGTPTS